MKLRIRNQILSSAALVALGLSGTAFANEGGAESAASDAQEEVDDSSSTPNIIIVSARRRDENLQDVPVTVTVFGAEEIQNARIQQIEDIVSRTPGLNFDSFPASQPRLFIRGIGSSDRGASGDPSSAVFVDEIYLGRPSAIAFDAFDIERIEVLKGPQGTLFGRNVVGGAINVITRKPDVTGFGAATELTYGNFDRLDAAGFVNIPFAENSGAIRVSAAYRSHDGYVHNAFLNTDVDDQDTLSGRFQFYAEPNDNLRVLFSVDGTRDRALGPGNHVLELDATDPRSNFYSPNFDPDISYGSEVGFQNRDTIGVRGEISNDFSFGTLTLLASYRDVDYQNSYDFDGGNADPTSPGFNGINISGGDTEKAELSSQEIRLSSLPDSPFTWVAGVYHYHQTVDRDTSFILDTALVAPFPLTEIYSQIASLDSVAVFGDVSVPLSDQFTIFGGLRYTRDDKSSRVFNTDSDAPLRGDEFFDVSGAADFDAVTYRAGVNFQPNNDHLFYASISNGFKSGGFQDTPPDALAAAVPYQPERAVQYEIGQKSTLFDGVVIWNNTLFYVDYTDLQTSQAINGRVETSNAGKATIKGYETQLDVRPFKGLQLSVAYAYTDGKLDIFEEGGVDYSGNRISRAPKHKVTVSPSFTYPMSDNIDVTLAADYRYTSMIFDDNSNLPPEFRDPTHFVDARIVVDGIADNFGLSFWGKNLTDERTRTFQSLFLGANFAAFNPPRTYGATLRWTY